MVPRQPQQWRWPDQASHGVATMPLNPDCLAALGLETEPFVPILEESALYCDALLDGFANLAVRALSEPSAILVLAGAGGVGRSTQLRQILSSLPATNELIAFRARPRIGFEAVDATLRFHLSDRGSEDSRASLVHLFSERLRAGHVLVLAIDDAHLLAEAVLEQILGLRRQLLERVGASLRFFLVGDPEFATNALPGLDPDTDANVLRLHLRAFNREQTYAYLRHRLQGAGHVQPDLLLKRDLIERLHRGSNGLPKYLNALAEDWLAEICDEAESPTRPEFRPERAEVAPPRSESARAASEEEPAVISAMTALEALRNASREALEVGARAGDAATGRSGGGGGDGADGQSPASGARQRQRRARASKARSPAGGSPLAPIWNRPWFVPGVAAFSLVALLLPLFWQLPGANSTASSPRQREVSTRARAPVAPGVLSVDRPVVPAPASAPVAPPVAPLADSALRQRALDIPLVLSGDAPVDALPPPLAGLAGDPPRLDWAERGSEGLAETEAAGAARTQTAESAPPAEVEPERIDSDAGELDRDWILRQPGQHFTVQLAAVRSAAAARAHVAGLRGVDVRLVPIRSRSQDFVVVLAGVYSAQAEAERAVATLPAALRDQGYWIRTINSVRQSLRD